MPALTPRAMPVRENNSALLHVLEAYIETLKAENESLKRQLAARERCPWWCRRLARLMIEPPGPIRGEGAATHPPHRPDDAVQRPRDATDRRGALCDRRPARMGLSARRWSAPWPRCGGSWQGRAHDNLAADRARPWWRRLAG